MSNYNIRRTRDDLGLILLHRHHKEESSVIEKRIFNTIVTWALLYDYMLDQKVYSYLYINILYIIRNDFK